MAKRYTTTWDAHLVEERDDGTALIYIDRHLLHEVTSPQALRGSPLPTETCAPQRQPRGA